jgi:hypothetical protein
MSFYFIVPNEKYITPHAGAIEMLLNINEKFCLSNLKTSLLQTFVFNQLSLSILMCWPRSDIT